MAFFSVCKLGYIWPLPLGYATRVPVRTCSCTESALCRGKLGIPDIIPCGSCLETTAVKKAIQTSEVSGKATCLPSQDVGNVWLLLRTLKAVVTFCFARLRDRKRRVDEVMYGIAD